MKSMRTSLDIKVKFVAEGRKMKGGAFEVLPASFMGAKHLKKNTQHTTTYCMCTQNSTHNHLLISARYWWWCYLNGKKEEGGGYCARFRIGIYGHMPNILYAQNRAIGNATMIILIRIWEGEREARCSFSQREIADFYGTCYILMLLLLLF